MAVVTSLALDAVPPVRAWRRRFRAARSEHHHRTLGDTLTDLYMVLWFVLIYGGALYMEVRRHLDSPAAREGAVDRHWLTVAGLLAGAGLAWRGLRAIGPVFVSPAEQHWAVSSPLARGRWLSKRFVVMTVSGAAVGALAAFSVVLLGLRGGPGRAALAGAAWGTVLVGMAVVAQRAGERRLWDRAVPATLLGAGGVLALAAIAAHWTGRAVPAPAPGTGLALTAVGVPLAGGAVWAAARALSTLDRARLGAGATLAAAVVTAAVWLDITVLGGVLELRRWRQVGRVRSRRPVPVPGVPGRVSALIQAEALRTARRPGTLAVWAGLGVAQYGMVVAAPDLAGVSRVILAYVVAGRLMAGLRAVARSRGLRRALGGSELLLRTSHAVVPGALTGLWWLATVPAGDDLGAVGLLLAAGAVAAAYRAATRGPIDYSTDILETPFGPLPVGLVTQLGRGPDLLGAVIVARFLLA